MIQGRGMIRDFSKDEMEGCRERPRHRTHARGRHTLRPRTRASVLCCTSASARDILSDIAVRRESATVCAVPQIRSHSGANRVRFQAWSRWAGGGSVADSGSATAMSPAILPRNSTQPAQTVPTVAGGNAGSPQPQVKPALMRRYRPALCRSSQSECNPLPRSRCNRR